MAEFEISLFGEMKALVNTLSDEGERNDSQLLRNGVLRCYGKALCSKSSLPSSTTNYLDHVERCVLLESRAMLERASLCPQRYGRFGWKPLPELDDTPDCKLDDTLHRCLLVVSRKEKEKINNVERIVERTLLCVAFLNSIKTEYMYEAVVKTALDAFGSVGNAYAEREIDYSWSEWNEYRRDLHINLGYVGDALAALESVALVRLQGHASPLLRAVAAPSRRIEGTKASGWRAPGVGVNNLNNDQFTALSDLRYNLEAITGHPGTRLYFHA